MTTVNPVSTKRVWVVVLGDIGRSPRMQNHVKSFAENGYLVEVVGYLESRVNQVNLFTQHVYSFRPELITIANRTD